MVDVEGYERPATATARHKVASKYLIFLLLLRVMMEMYRDLLSAKQRECQKDCGARYALPLAIDTAAKE